MATNKTVTVTVLPTLTGDTVASYNVYEGVSGTTLLGTMSVAEAAAGKVFAFTDGIVHSVKTQTVWTTAGASAIRSAGVSLDLSGILLHDDFTGTTIDPSKWNVVNANTSDVLISQDDDMEFSQLTEDGSVGTWSEYIESVLSFDMSGDIVFKFGISRNYVATGASVNFYLGFSDGLSSDDVFAFTRNSVIPYDASNVRCRTGGADDGYEVITDTFTGVYKIVKLANGDITGYKWNGSAWDDATPITGGPTSGSRKFYLTQGNQVVPYENPPWNLNLDNLYITNADFSTLNPV